MFQVCQKIIRTKSETRPESFTALTAVISFLRLCALVLKLLPSRAFPVEGRCAGSHARKKIG